MRIDTINAVVTGGASGLGLATATRLIEGGATVTLIDLPNSDGAEQASRLGAAATFVAADVTDGAAVEAAFADAQTRGPVRAVVHCAGRGKPMRILDKAGKATDLDPFESVIGLNVIGTFNVLRFAAQAMASNEELDGDRGAVVLTASVAAYEGQIGQINYAASKAAVVGMTLPAARDLATVGIRVNTIAPGVFATPLLLNARDDIREALAAAVPHPKRLGDPTEFAALAEHMISNGMINGETVRLDGAIRMGPR
ncbi:SDR family NAD(P)-dependent oxidoreductase [Gordonia hydrophobica]|uniref:SDR family NAD(P)-dependent oxidoreductase n=1 Tax=Gordonia hydrophobica TaxID=40516 RepID=A0ABZ2U141_9ACTN|nr:SDR family NAD(P)-dependent oxidoreductase [Gordonia hydrophobica]MBM7368474.1 NAD(P)-dependent dehydrogenase (short-subunit alcohol dehydrogenase family) [Gordonia hydrophobica]